MKKIFFTVVLATMVGCGAIELTSCSGDDELKEVVQGTYGLYKVQVTLSGDWKDFIVITSFAGSQKDGGNLTYLNTGEKTALAYAISDDKKEQVMSCQTSEDGIGIAGGVNVGTGRPECVGKSMGIEVKVFKNGKVLKSEKKTIVGTLNVTNTQIFLTSEEN